jgi:hypothetical protein
VKEKLVEGIDFYYNEEGYVVLTEQYHLNKGYCCGLACRHCPYDHKAVDASRKNMLLDAWKKSGDEKEKS